MSKRQGKRSSMGGLRQGTSSGRTKTGISSKSFFSSCEMG
jgi:hypothetical protein